MLATAFWELELLAMCWQRSVWEQELLAKCWQRSGDLNWKCLSKEKVTFVLNPLRLVTFCYKPEQPEMAVLVARMGYLIERVAWLQIVACMERTFFIRHALWAGSKIFACTQEAKSTGPRPKSLYKFGKYIPL
eukprot:scaffold108952_cov17-Tisochrysis_lutea.AAC.3